MSCHEDASYTKPIISIFKMNYPLNHSFFIILNDTNTIAVQIKVSNYTKIENNLSLHIVRT